MFFHMTISLLAMSAVALLALPTAAGQRDARTPAALRCSDGEIAVSGESGWRCSNQLDRLGNAVRSLRSTVDDLQGRVEDLEMRDPGGGGSGSAAYRFVGFSSGATNGGAGYAGMYALCQADFGSNARTCTTQEYILSPNAGAPERFAWISGVIVAVTDQGRPIDVSGVRANFLACEGWTNSVNLTGMGVNAQGGLLILQCQSSYPVTCCAPPE